MTVGETTGSSSRAGDLQRRSRGQVAMLGAEFLLGMAVNLIGLPSETTGGVKTATAVLLGLHVVIAVGLTVGAILAVRSAQGTGGRGLRLAGGGAAAVVVTFVVGVLTMITGNGWLSYLMAVGFLVALLIYGALAVDGGRGTG